MDKRFSEIFNKEVDRYQSALRYFAQVCDWESFEANAAKLFEYLESTEVSLLKKKFHRTIIIILVVLVAALALFATLGSAVPFFTKYRDLPTITVLVGSIFELLLLLELRLYLNIRASRQKRREEQFIRGIEGDAKANLKTDACRAATLRP